MQVRFYDIDWDTDDEDVDLPAEVTLEVDDDLDVEEEGSDILSDQYGWCVKGVNYEVLTTAHGIPRRMGY